jgi:hypothetical protein
MDAYLVNILAVGIILSAPWLPLTYKFVENPIIRLLLVVSLVVAIRLGPLPGLLTLLAVVTLLVERNHYVLTHLTYQLDNAILPAAGTDRIIKSSSDIPEGEAVSYTPVKDTTNEFVDSNPRFPEGPNNEDAVGFFKGKGLA